MGRGWRLRQEGDATLSDGTVNQAGSQEKKKTDALQCLPQQFTGEGIWCTKLTATKWSGNNSRIN